MKEKKKTNMQSGTHNAFHTHTDKKKEYQEKW